MEHFCKHLVKSNEIPSNAIRAKEATLVKESCFAYFHTHKSYFLLLQETNVFATDHSHWDREWGGHLHASFGNKNSRGVAILFRSIQTFSLLKKETGQNGRLIIIEISLNSNAFISINVYGPSIDDPRFYTSSIFNVLLKYGPGISTVFFIRNKINV